MIEDTIWLGKVSINQNKVSSEVCWKRVQYNSLCKKISNEISNLPKQLYFQSSQIETKNICSHLSIGKMGKDTVELYKSRLVWLLTIMIWRGLKKVTVKVAKIAYILVLFIYSHVA